MLHERRARAFRMMATGTTMPEVSDTAIRLTERRLVRFQLHATVYALVAAIDFGKRRRKAST